MTDLRGVMDLRGAVDLQMLRPSNDPQMAVALLISAVLHVIVLLGLGFTAPDPGGGEGETLTMVDYLPPGGGPEQAEAPDARSASRSQQARGSDSREREATAPDAGRQPGPPRPAPRPARAEEQTEPRPAASTARPGPSGSDRKEVMTADKAETRVAEPRDSGEQAASAPQAERAPGSLQLFPSDRQIARWDEERRDRKVRAEADGKARMATRRDSVAAYTSSLLNKVRRVGNMNYPDEARERGITGKVRLQLHLRPDGSLIRVRVLESSGSDVLDASAKQIIRLSAPFSPFPEAMQKRHPDSYRITHFMNFTRDGRLSRPPGG